MSDVDLARELIGIFNKITRLEPSHGLVVVMMEVFKTAHRRGKSEGFRKAYDRLAKHLDTRREENRDLRKCLAKTEEALEAMTRKCETLEAEFHARG